MKWQGRAGSRNVSDRRASGGMVVGGVGLVVLLAYTLITGDPMALITSLLGGGGNNTLLTAEEEEMAQFVSVVLADTETVWTDVFEDYGSTYEPATLVLYKNTTNSGCGTASAQTGPFYCSVDQSIYIDLDFYSTVRDRFDAPGDFAMAYVIAHEVGHHVQNLTGILEDYYEARSQLSTTQANALTVRLELQADYLSGVWAHHIQGMGYLEAGDLQEALTAAAAVGDDTIQMQSSGRVIPETFTHGTSEQRSSWFMKGFNEGDLDQWDTFTITNP